MRCTVYSKNRDRLLEGEIAEKFFAQVLSHARAADLLSDERFSVDGTLIEAGLDRRAFRKRAVVTKGRRTTPAIRRWTFTVRSAAMKRTNRRRTAMPDWRGRAAGMKRSWPTAVM